jgi:molybdate transport system substrate-binding protein
MRFYTSHASVHLKWCTGLLFLLMLSCQPARHQHEPVRIFAAASLSSVLGDMPFDSGQQVQYSFASSGILARQIAQGAPCDIFISANVQWVDHLVENNQADPDHVRPLAGNRLVAVAPAGSALDTLVFDERLGVALAALTHIATGDPAHVPAGQYAREVLQHYGAFDRLGPKIIFAPNASATLRLVALGEAELGLVYHSDALASDDVKIIGIPPPHSYGRIAYQAVLINTGSEDARRAYNMLTGRHARAIWQRHGFLPAGE